MAITRCFVADDPELLQSVCDDLRRFGLETVAAATAARMRACLAQGGIDLGQVFRRAPVRPRAPRR